MRAYQIKAGQRIAGLNRIQSSISALAAHEVHVRVHAVSLNSRDLMIADGKYLGTGEVSVIPCSDGAGDVMAVGAEVTRFRVGDRVAVSFFPRLDLWRTYGAKHSRCARRWRGRYAGGRNRFA